MLKSIFIGNSNFVMPLLETIKEKTHLVGIITGQDRIITKRKKSIVFPEPKIFGQKHQIPVFQPLKIKDPIFLNQIQNLQADIFFLCSFNRILPPELFNLPPLGCFNFHASLLPLYRGASPLYQALLNGDSETGITLQKINENIDEGNIFWIKKIPIDSTEIFPTLKNRMALLAQEVCHDFIEYWVKNQCLPPEQTQQGIPSFCSKIEKKDELIAFQTHTAQKIFNQYLAFYTWPQISFYFKNNKIKIKQCSYLNENSKYPAATLIEEHKDALWIQTKDGILSIHLLQLKNKSTISGKAFMNGYQLKIGDLLI